MNGFYVLYREENRDNAFSVKYFTESGILEMQQFVQDLVGSSILVSDITVIKGQTMKIKTIVE